MRLARSIGLTFVRRPSETNASAQAWLVELWIASLTEGACVAPSGKGCACSGDSATDIPAKTASKFQMSNPRELRTMVIFGS
jgi:hypothetical protein